MLRWLIARIPVQRLAVVPFSGAIFRRGIDDYLRLFKALEMARNIRGVMLEMESPGGSATASEMLFDRLKRLNDRKPLYCYAPMAASGGYMAALGARRIYAPSTALLGSIGVLSVKPVIKDLMERFGIRLEVMKKGAMKDMGLFHRESTEEEKRSWDALHEAVYERFMEMIASSRRLDMDNVRGMATGELFTALRAKELGLIDGVMDFEGAMDELAMETGVKKERAVTVRPRKPILKRMMSEAAGAFTDEFISQMYR
jgi:protease-4